MVTDSRMRFLIRRSLPIVRDFACDLTDVEHDRIGQVANRLVRDEPALSAAGVFGPLVSCGIGPGPALLFEDHSATALANRRDGSLLEYRTIFLAQEGDLFLVGHPRDREFEAYCQANLGIGRIDVDRPDGSGQRSALAQRCAGDPRIMERIAALARRGGGLSLITYMGTGHVWRLARKIADLSGRRVSVASPRPRLARRVNDKLWFSRLVTDLLGSEALPSTYTAYGPAALAGRVRMLARDHERVVAKVPDSAGSEGNLVLRSADYRDLSVGEIRWRLLSAMARLGWGETFPMAVSVWEAPVIDSPSVQIWIPRQEDGPPVVQGIFSQVVSGTVGQFAGAVPCSLPGEWRQRIGHEAVVLATLLQALGYFGPCGFDALVTGRDLGAARLQWVECNGRWTGVSIPLVLVNRLVGDWHDRALVIVQETGLERKPFSSFGEVVKRLRSRLFTVDGPAEGAIVLSPARVVGGTGLHLLVLAATADLARKKCDAVRAIFLGETNRTPEGSQTMSR